MKYFLKNVFFVCLSNFVYVEFVGSNLKFYPSPHFVIADIQTMFCKQCLSTVLIHQYTKFYTFACTNSQLLLSVENTKAVFQRPLFLSFQFYRKLPRPKFVFSFTSLRNHHLVFIDCRTFIKRRLESPSVE